MSVINNDKNWRILIVDDEPNNVRLLRQILKGQYNISIASDGIQAIEVAQKVQPDLILMDVMMPVMDGYTACIKLKSNPDTASIPVIFITAKTEIKDEKKGFEVGGVDYITKPISGPIVQARVATHLALYDQQRASQIIIEQRTKELAQIQRAAIFMLGEAGHYNDTDTGLHIWRMAAFSSTIARSAGWNVDDAQQLEIAAPMHDTGKIGIADDILKKPGKLDADQWHVMKTHSQIGYDILSKSNTPLFQMAADIALSHHEKWDGNGYPKGLKGEEIPESARIVAIADVFDALTSQRPYKKAWPINDAVDEIQRSSGSHFDPRLVDCFLQCLDQIIHVKSTWDTREQDNENIIE